MRQVYGILGKMRKIKMLLPDEDKHTEWRWASINCAHNMPHPDELEYLGYKRVIEHPWYPGTYLYRRVICPLQSQSGVLAGNIQT